jgi:hypothetical protein
MSIRTFIFCDICNPQGLRSIEFRRHPRRDRTGRRLSDGRSWVEGNISSAVENGWSINSEGKHICPVCKEHTQLE